MFLALAGSAGEPGTAKIAAIDQKARLYPPKRSPWHGTADAAMKVTLWNGNGTGLPQKMKVDARLGGGQARDFYWFEAGKAAYGTQSRWSGGEAIERRLTFTAGKVTAAQERRAATDRALATAAFHELPAAELAKVSASVTSLLQECLKAPGLRDRKATVKSVERDRVILQTSTGVDAWITRRSGDEVASSLIGRQVSYDFTAVEQEGQELDYLNRLEPLGKADAVAPPSAPAGPATGARAKTMLAKSTPGKAVATAAVAAPAASPATVEASAVAADTVKSTVKPAAKKKITRKGTRKSRARKKTAPAQP